MIKGGEKIMTIKEQKSDVDQLISKLAELVEISSKVIGITELSILKVGSIYGDLNNIALMFSGEGRLFENSGKTFTNIKNKLIDISKSMNLVENKTKLAAVASKTFQTLMNPAALGAIAIGVLGISAAVFTMCRKESEATKAAKENLKISKQQIEQWNEMNSASKEGLSTSLSQIELAKNYGKELNQLISDSEQTIESQGRINFLVDRLNNILPDLGLHYDEVSGKMVDMNGNAVELEKTLDSFIKHQEGQAYLDAYLDDYEIALKEKGILKREQRKLKQEIENTEAIWDGYIEASKTAAEKYGDNSRAYFEEMQKYFDKVGMIDIEIWDMKNNLDVLRETYANNELALEKYEGTINEFRKMQTATNTEDWDTVLAVINGINDVQLFDPVKGKEQVETLRAQREELQLIKADLEEAKNNNEEIDEDLYRVVTERLDLAEAEVDKATKYFEEKNKKMGEEIGQKLHDALTGKMSETGLQMADQMTADAQSGIENINTIINSTPMQELVIPVVYRYLNSPSSLIRATSSKIGASYDDFLESPLMISSVGNEAPDFMAEARKTIHSIQTRISNGLVSMPVFEAKLVGAGNKQVDVSQTNVFNVPVQKPSDVTRAIEKMNRELAKKL